MVTIRPRTVMRSRLRCTLPAHVAVLTAIVTLHRETIVGPELALSAETMRGLQQCDQQSCSNRTSGEVYQPLHNSQAAIAAAAY